jgi:hypothetical protein
MGESHSQLASVGSESEIEPSPATQAITILGLRFNVQSPSSRRTALVTFARREKPGHQIRRDWKAFGTTLPPRPNRER